MSTEKVTYKLTAQAGYKANIAKIGDNTYDPIAYYHKANFPDVEITRPNTDTDLELIHRKCLLTVNGYIHPTVFQDKRLYVPNATESMLKTKANHIGLLSFSKLSNDLVKRPITLDLITPESPSTLYEKAIITFEEAVGSCFLVLAGYPVFEQSEFFYRVSDRSFVIRLDRLSYIERLYELSRYRNIFDDLGVEVSPNNSHMIDGTIVRGDAVISKFLTLNNTFLVETPGYSLTVKKIYLEHSNVPGNFRTEINPGYPLLGGYGKFIEHLVVKVNDTKYQIQTTDAYLNNYLFSKLSTQKTNVYNDNRRVGNTYELSRAFFLELECVPQ